MKARKAKKAERDHSDSDAPPVVIRPPKYLTFTRKEGVVKISYAHRRNRILIAVNVCAPIVVELRPGALIHDLDVPAAEFKRDAKVRADEADGLLRTTGIDRLLEALEPHATRVELLVFELRLRGMDVEHIATIAQVPQNEVNDLLAAFAPIAAAAGWNLRETLPKVPE